MLKKKAAIIVSMVFGIALFAVTAWGLDLKAGKYEITSKVEMAGMPGQIPPTTVTQCLTDQDPVPNKTAAGQDCKISEIKTKGNTVSWDMECDQQGVKVKSTGQMTYAGDRFEGTIKTIMGPESGNMTINTVVSGKRIGECK